MKLLLTAFEPFGGEEKNASLEAFRLVPEEIAGAKIVRRVLPVVFGEAERAIREAVREEAPDAVLCLGQAAGRAALTPERAAVNLADARIPDNAGRQPTGEPLIPGGAEKLFASLPVEAMCEEIREAGLPAELSDSAGSFVCNAVLYALLDELSRRPGARGGFLHLPALSEDFPAQALARGVEAAVRAIVEK